MTSSNSDINDICKQFKISEEDEIKFNKLRDEIATFGQQIIALNESRCNAINKMQDLLDKYTIDSNIVNNFINNVEKNTNTTIINENHTPKIISDENIEPETKPKKTTKKKSGAAATVVEDEPEQEETVENKEEQESEIPDETNEAETNKVSKTIKKRTTNKKAQSNTNKTTEKTKTPKKTVAKKASAKKSG